MEFLTRCLKYTCWDGYLSYFFYPNYYSLLWKELWSCHTYSDKRLRGKQYVDTGHGRDSCFNCAAYAFVRNNIVSNIAGSM